jgi:hypothetical protein
MHYRKRALCRVPEALGKALKTLGKGFAECDTRQRSLCRVLEYAECPTLGKLALYRAQDVAECGTRQSRLCRVPDKKHSAKPPALGKGANSGSVGTIFI